MQYQQVTQGGYGLYDVISALQKEIRRGLEEQAYYWALELCPRYEAYLWRRLCVIANEDIGLAAPCVMQLVPTQRELYFELRAQRGGNGSAKLILSNTVLMMCRAPKSRLADEFHCVVEQERRHGLKLDIPDYALDRHTATGKRRGRGYEHWLEEGCQLVPLSQEVKNPYIERAKMFWLGDFIRGGDWGTRKSKDEPAPTQGTLFESGEDD